MSDEATNKMAWKRLSRNDIGATGSHQAGVHIPRDLVATGLFDDLGTANKNPRRTLEIALPDGSMVPAEYIYYNNRFFGGTRNEYRITRLSTALRKLGAQEGDTLRIEREERLRYTVNLSNEKSTLIGATEEGRTRLRLAGGWIVHTIRRKR